MGRPFLALLLVVDTGPECTVDCFCGPFDEGRALPAPMHPKLLSTALSHGCDAAVLLHLRSVLESIPVFTEAVDLRIEKQNNSSSNQVVVQIRADMGFNFVAM